VFVAMYVLAWRHGRDRGLVDRVVDGALGPICAIVLITGAGGMFGGVLRATGIGGAIAESLESLGLPLIVAGFVIAAIVRMAQGSATVALTTAAALVQPAVQASTRASWPRWSSPSPRARSSPATSTTPASGWSAASSAWTPPPP
jgi:H+/gluconate symporter-like permease